MTIQYIAIGGIIICFICIIYALTMKTSDTNIYVKLTLKELKEIEHQAFLAGLESKQNEQYIGKTINIDKEFNLEKEVVNFVQTKEFVKTESPVLAIAKHFYELGLTQK